MIPKIIHQIWIGNNPPTYIDDYMNLIRLTNPSFVYMRWGNESLERFGVKNLFGNTPESFIADIMRVKILQEFGGWYIDADTIPFGDFSRFPDEIYEQKIVSCLIDNMVQYKFNNAFIGSEKGFDFSWFIENYEPVRPCVPTWNEFLHERNPYEICTSLYGIKSNVFRDTRENTWMAHKKFDKEKLWH